MTLLTLCPVENKCFLRACGPAENPAVFNRTAKNFHKVVAEGSESQAPTVKPGGPDLRPAHLSLQSTGGTFANVTNPGLC